jgi:hypothetical protein
MRSVILALALATGLFIGDGGSMIVTPAAAQEEKIVAQDACTTAQDSRDLVEASLFHPMMGAVLFQEKLKSGACIEFDTPEEVQVVKVLDTIRIDSSIVLDLVEVRVSRTGQTLYGVLVRQDTQS